MKKIALLILLIAFIFSIQAQTTIDNRIEPPSWWTGMENSKLQLLIHKDDVSDFTKASVSTEDILIKSLATLESPNYLFLNLELSEQLKEGIYTFTLFSQEDKFQFDYRFESRRKGSKERSGFNSSDVIYLIMPDRFANGNPENDTMDETIESKKRDWKDGRHGGDIKGIIDHLDYLEDLGITTIWNTPLLLDNEKKVSYHGYACADYYKIDPRYGSNEDFRKLSQECNERGMKLIMDYVPNHCGSAHWWMSDLPSEDWVHQFPEFTRSNHRKQTINDPYGVEEELEGYTKGWFDTTMPDMNLKNPYLRQYFIQNAIWWIEFADLDGLRVDTYPYSDKWAIADWAKALRNEYPNTNIVGECWQHLPSELAYWQSGVENYDGYDSQLPTGMDFYLTDQLEKAFNEDKQNWNDGVARLYNCLSTDYLYANPDKLMTFCDNHDLTRYSGTVKNDKDAYKLAFSFLLTTRGIPQIYYGSEIMMEGSKSIGDGDIRRDFPGGWPGDTRSAFSSKGRTDLENEVFDHFRNLLQYRKENEVLHNGRLTHFIPHDNIYVYFRTNDNKTVMIIMNNNKKAKTIDTERYQSLMKDYEFAKDVLSNNIITNLQEIEIKSKSALVLELMHYKD